MNKALLCIARQKSFVVNELSAGLTPETTYAVTLNGMNSVPLRSAPKILLVAGQNITIYEWRPAVTDEQYRVQALSYFYAFTTMIDQKEVELLTFEWRRDPGPTYPFPHGHLHVGSGLLAKPTVVRPEGFHKAHIPTKRLSFESIVRFAIAELNVEPQNANWRTILDASEMAFEQHKTD